MDTVPEGEVMLTIAIASTRGTRLYVLVNESEGTQFDFP
jgi:hypothetical protein